LTEGFVSSPVGSCELCASSAKVEQASGWCFDCLECLQGWTELLRISAKDELDPEDVYELAVINEQGRLPFYVRHCRDRDCPFGWYRQYQWTTHDPADPRHPDRRMVR
jgi:hypothetical protein